MKIFVAGYPGNMGGANTECWATVKLWREGGLDVEMIPTWGSDAQQAAKLSAIGVKTHHVRPEDIATIPGLAGSIVVSFCNSRFVAEAHRFRQLGCPVVWSNCMSFLFEHEIAHFRKYGLFEAFHFQSRFQQRELSRDLQPFGYKVTCCGTPPDERGYLIPGAFDFDAFPLRLRKHSAGEPFVFGRLARPDQDKWSSNTWPIYQAVPYRHKRARLLGVTQQTIRKLGRGPDWGELLEPQSESASDFLASLHALVPINGGARENWPRVGLEAMATGVPIVTQNQWGWREMVLHGATGFLANDDYELAYYTARLAYEPALREKLAHAGRQRVEKLAHPQRLFKLWRRLFEQVASRGSTFGQQPTPAAKPPAAAYTAGDIRPIELKESGQ